MRLDDVLSAARDNLTVRRVFAEPYTSDGVTVIAAARVIGGGGGGGGTDPHGGEGEGGGLGMIARPAGAYVIKNGEVRWEPALDLNRLITVAGAIMIAFLLTRARRAKG